MYPQSLLVLTVVLLVWRLSNASPTNPDVNPDPAAKKKRKKPPQEELTVQLRSSRRKKTDKVAVSPALKKRAAEEATAAVAVSAEKRAAEEATAVEAVTVDKPNVLFYTCLLRVPLVRNGFRVC